MLSYHGVGVSEYWKLRGIAKKVRAGIVPKDTSQETIWKALRVTRPKTATELFGFLTAKVHGPDGQLKRDCGLVSVKTVTAAFAKHIVDALCSTGGGDTFATYGYHKMGTASGAEASGDAALGAAQSGATLGTCTHGASSQIWASTAIVTATTTLHIREHGVFNASTGGLLLDRSTVANIDLVTDDTVTWSYTLTVNSET